jgi:hypothetical protein
MPAAALLRFSTQDASQTFPGTYNLIGGRAGDLTPFGVGVSREDCMTISKKPRLRFLYRNAKQNASGLLRQTSIRVEQGLLQFPAVVSIRVDQHNDTVAIREVCVSAQLRWQLIQQSAVL